LALVPFKSLDLYIDEFAEVMEVIFPYFILMMYVMPLYRTTYSIVHEKVILISFNIFIEFNGKREHEDDGSCRGSILVVMVNILCLRDPFDNIGRSICVKDQCVY
jgi:hypothetical protein